MTCLCLNTESFIFKMHFQQQTRFSIILTLNTLFTNILASEIVYDGPAAARGFFNTRMTLSPRRNILEMNLSLLTGLAFFFPDNKELN